MKFFKRELEYGRRFVVKRGIRRHFPKWRRGSWVSSSPGGWSHLGPYARFRI